MDAKKKGGSYPPDELYTNKELQEFITRCKETNKNWAILSDFYGIFPPNEKHEYYEKPPSTVTPDEERVITQDFHSRLVDYKEIWFFIRKDTFHPFYERVLRNGLLHPRVTLFYDRNEIK